MVKVPGVKSRRVITTEKDTWDILFSSTISNEIVTHTNEEMLRQSVNYQTDTKYIDPTDTAEISALIGLLYIAGAWRDAHVSTQ